MKRREFLKVITVIPMATYLSLGSSLALPSRTITIDNMVPMRDYLLIGFDNMPVDDMFHLAGSIMKARDGKDGR